MLDWIALYKLARLAFLASTLVGVGAWLFAESRREALERPALRMLDDDDVAQELPR